MVSITLDDVTKEYGSLTAVDDLSLTIEDGEFVSLVGPSGCGKTTTLRMVAGLESVTSGQIRYGDRTVTTAPVQQRGVALLFQDIALYPHMTVEENIAYPLKLAGIDGSDRHERVVETASLLQVEDQLAKYPGDLSGGQQQRVALGRSIIREPTLFLFDEPMSDLDAKLKHELRPLFAEITDQVGCPTLYVTHDQEEAMTMSDRIAVMNDGHLEQIDTPDRVYRQPDTQFVGEFVGRPAMEFFDVRIEHGDDGSELLAGENLTLAHDGLNGYDGDDLRVGIRPQHLRVTERNSSGIPATHVFDETLGDRTHSLFETPLGRVTVETPADFRGSQTEYSIEIDVEKLSLYDPASGIRIG
ncbi:ABC transporter ATP-binding protein [Halocatena halophila]|uniref:ABC transporter ATP-binding protein n=1 Tax=Halocatena halophila TaxID=2814576 RepID=UPI002ED2C356